MDSEKSGFVNKMNEIWRKKQVNFFGTKRYTHLSYAFSMGGLSESDKKDNPNEKGLKNKKSGRP